MVGNRTVASEGHFSSTREYTSSPWNQQSPWNMTHYQATLLFTSMVPRLPLLHDSTAYYTVKYIIKGEMVLNVHETTIQKLHYIQSMLLPVTQWTVSIPEIGR